jgi:hypothetical protein
MVVLMNFVSQKNTSPIRNNEPNSATIFAYHFFTTFWRLSISGIQVTFAIVSINFHTTNIKLYERNKLLTVHGSINKKCGSYLKYQKYGVFTLLGIRINVGFGYRGPTVLITMVLHTHRYYIINLKCFN